MIITNKNTRLIVAVAVISAMLAVPVFAQTLPPGAQLFGSFMNRELTPGIFDLALFASIGPNQTATPGDTFTHSFSLVQTDNKTLPDLNYADGSVTRLYKSYRFTDPVGTKILDAYDELNSTTYTSGSVISYPVSFGVTSATPSGDYAVVAILFKVPQTWSTSTNTWTEGSAVLLDKQGVTFKVSTPTPPPAPSTSGILAFITTTFNNLLCYIKTLFGLPC